MISRERMLAQIAATKKENYKMDMVECLICHKNRERFEMLRCVNGAVCIDCIPDIMHNTFRYTRFYIWQEGTTVVTNCDAVLFYKEIPSDILATIKGVPINIYLIGNIEYTFTKFGKTNQTFYLYDTPLLTFKDIGNEYSHLEIGVECFCEANIKVEQCEFYGLYINTNSSFLSMREFVRNVSIIKSIIRRYIAFYQNTQMINVVCSYVETALVHDITLIETKIEEFHVCDLDTLQCDTVTIDALQQIELIGKVELENTIISRGIVNAKFGYLKECRCIVMENSNLQIEGGEVVQKKIKICCVCKMPMTSNLYTIRGKEIHAKCWERDGRRSYNDKKLGNIPDGLPTFSIELEMNGETSYHANYEKLMLELLENEFIRCGDGTVDDELKSPIYHNLTTFVKQEQLYRDAIPFINNSARTHVHIGASSAVRSILKGNYETLLGKTADYLSGDSQGTYNFFGCTSSHLCSYHWTGDRFVWLNPLSRYDTLEYRLSRLLSWEQFFRLVKFFRNFTVFLESELQSLDSTTARQPKTKEKKAYKILKYYIDTLSSYDIPIKEDTILTPPRVISPRIDTHTTLIQSFNSPISDVYYNPNTVNYHYSPNSYGYGYDEFEEEEF